MAMTVSGTLLTVGVALGVLSLVLTKPLEKSEPKAAIKEAPLAIDVRMPDVQPTMKDTYLCYLAPATKDALYITSFQPHGNMSYAHHILLYGCAEPGHKDVWDCGEMAGTGGGFEKAPVCKSGAQIIYAWAMDAPKLTLPEDVAFKVYGDSGINHLVLQVHYMNVDNFVPPKSHTDNSGLTLTATTTPQPKLAGVYLMGTGGEIAAHSTVYMETACSMNEPLVLHPFAFRAHAHTHGEVVSGYRVRDNKWVELGRISPKLPEMFYNITSPGITVKPGDTLAARCTMVNNEDRNVEIGETSHDEMCNFYMMYWVNGDHLLKNHYCFTPGPPTWNWSELAGLNSDGVPKDASIVPGTTKLLEATHKMMDNVQELLEGDNGQIEAEVEQFLQQMQQRLGRDFVEETDREIPEEKNELLEAMARRGVEEEDPYMEEQQERWYDNQPAMENLLNNLYQEGFNKMSYGDQQDDELYEQRAIRGYPQVYNPWVENGEETYY